MLYHINVYMPRRIKSKAPQGIQTPEYSQHAQRAANSDKYGLLCLPLYFDMSQATLVEAEEFQKDQPLTKVVFRHPYNEKVDMVVVAIPKKNKILYVKTVWFNEVGDTHKTLDTNRFALK